MSEKFQMIKTISPNDKDTWEDKFFLTIDIDWASDEIIHDTIDLIEAEDVCVTWFITHETPVLDRIKENPKFELGVHPNFNFLLQGSDQQGKDTNDVISRIMKVVPDATSVRSHSMTQNTNLLKMFFEHGLTHDCNHFIPHQSGVELKPWTLWTELIKVPYSWEDDIACLYGDIEDFKIMKFQKGLRVFDFHPIHIFLNTEDMARYERTREKHRNYEALLCERNQSNIGARDVLKSILRWK